MHVRGNNGGVHLAEVDIIALGEGVRIENANGAGANRETFITHATMDSNGVGLHINDASYTSIVGCWAASNKHQILTRSCSMKGRAGRTSSLRAAPYLTAGCLVCCCSGARVRPLSRVVHQVLHAACRRRLQRGWR